MFPSEREIALLNDGRNVGAMANNSRTSKLEQQIDDNLRRVYADVAQEPLPDRFSKLLDQLREKGKAEPVRSSEDEQ